jgi:murein DD-endopeptidase MepM/ murein hydrolase activator NlpD
MPPRIARRPALLLAAGTLPLAAVAPLARPWPALAGAAPAEVDRAGVERVEIVAREVRQGNTVFLRVWSATAQAVTATVEGQEVPLRRAGDAGGEGDAGGPDERPFVGLVGTQRYATLGPRRVRFAVVGPDGLTRARDDPADSFRVVDAGYPISRIQMPPSSMSLLDPAKVQAENLFLGGVYGRWRDERSWRVPFSLPAGEARITAGFGNRWSINGGPANAWHEGTDYGVRTGTPIRSAAAGQVAFAGPLHVRGNVVIVDHGWGVMSGYFHFSELGVQEGDAVEADQVIGRSGATGWVNGPHLHFEVRVHNVNVEPLEWLADPAFPRPELAALA